MRNGATAEVQVLLNTLLDQWLANVHRSQRLQADLLRVRYGRLTFHMQRQPPAVSVEFDSRGKASLELSIRPDAPPVLRGRCTCDAGRTGTKCAHQIVIASILHEHADDPTFEPVTHLHTALAPPTPEQLLERFSRALSTLPQPREQESSRLVWVLTEATYRGRKFEPMVREPKKNGELGRPKNVSRERLLGLLEGSPFPGERRLGERIGARLRDPYAYGPIDFAQHLDLFVGHPDVHFGEWPNPLAIDEAPPTLSMRHDGDEVVFEVTQGGQPLGPWGRTDELLVRRDEPNQRFLVGRLTPAIAQLAGAFSSGMRLPKELAPRALERLWPVAGRVPLQLPPEFMPQETAADPRLRVAIEGSGGQWNVRLLVRPLGTGDGFAPGAGPVEIVGQVEGAPRRTRRALDAERNAAEALSSRLALDLDEPDWSAALLTDGLLELATAVAEVPDVLVEWPAKPPQILASKAHLKVQIGRTTDWFGVEGLANIDGVEIALSRLLAARRDNKRFLELGGDRFVDLAKVFDERLRRLSDATREDRGKLALTRAAAPVAEELLAGVDEVRAPLDWDRLVERVRHAKTFEPRLPDGLQADLRDYQVDGFRWMRRLAELGLGGVLADDMGLGKTVQTIAVLLDRADGGPQLVVAPTSVAFNWMRELAKFAPSLKAHLLHEADREQLLGRVGPGDVVVTSWALLRFEEERLARVRWHTRVLDEAQAIKNWNTDTAIRTRRLQADWTIALTGTPVENHLGELFSLLETVCPGVFGSWEEFSRRWAGPIERGGDRDRQASLARVVRPLLLRRTKSQVATELPPRTEVRLDVELSKAERRRYEAARIAAAEMLAGASDDQQTDRIRVLAELTKLRQLASCGHLVDPEAPIESAKFTLLLEQLDEVREEGRAALVFSQFARQLALLSHVLEKRGIEHFVLTGETPQAERARLVDAFQRGEAKVFLISLKAGGTGLNLTAADTVFLLDPWWNPAVEDQAADRSHRIGQTRPVTVVRLVARGTIEEKVLELHERKRDLVRGVLGEADVAARLSTSQLVDLLRASQADDGALLDEPASIALPSPTPAKAALPPAKAAPTPAKAAPVPAKAAPAPAKAAPAPAKAAPAPAKAAPTPAKAAPTPAKADELDFISVMSAVNDEWVKRCAPSTLAQYDTTTRALLGHALPPGPTLTARIVAAVRSTAGQWGALKQNTRAQRASVMRNFAKALADQQLLDNAGHEELLRLANEVRG